MMDWILLLASILVFPCQAHGSVFYELSTTQMCSGVATEGTEVNMLCNMAADSIPCKNQSAADIQWLFSSTNTRVNIKDGDKYGVWNERKAGVITSVLKVRSIEERDAGVFTCLATCSDARITENKLKQQVDLCVKDAATSLTICSQSTSEESCTHVFSNGLCDEQCNSEDQLFDGGDCDDQSKVICHSGTSAAIDCMTGYGNGICNVNCSSSECGFDGGDCLPTVQSITRETVAIIVPASLSTDDITTIARQVSTGLSTLVQLHSEPLPWSPSNSGSILLTYLHAQVFQSSGSELLLLSLKLVPQSCEAGHRCFLRVTSAAKYLSHKLTANSSLISSQVAAIGINSDVDSCFEKKDLPSPSNRFTFVPKSQPKETSPKTDHHPIMGDMEIVFIAIGTAALFGIILGLYLFYRNYREAKAQKKSEAKQKHSNVKAYLETISDYSVETQGHINPHSLQSTISRSVTSKDAIIPGSRADNYKIDDCQV